MGDPFTKGRRGEADVPQGEKAHKSLAETRCSSVNLVLRHRKRTSHQIKRAFYISHLKIFQLVPHLSYLAWLIDGVNFIQKLFNWTAQTLGVVLNFFWPAPAASPIPVAVIDYDQLSVEGLRFREAIAVRSAEFWLALGEPRLALNELESLGDLAKQNDWVQCVRCHAVGPQKLCP